ncbi:uncharacterized protein METZ01_LOCUS403480 [marine metagenome]|uniref:Uncharacterized protein n=1 Tax=marine metagenome TaxID=408172 RepID=A0A382VVJ5_9ZZZZ
MSYYISPEEITLTVKELVHKIE